MKRIPRFAALSLILIATAGAQTPGGSVKIEPAKEVAIYAPKPDYTLAARARRLEGEGIFLLQLRADGTVKSVNIFKSTGHSELDASAVIAFRKWRFRPGMANKVKIPVTFSVEPASATTRRAHEGDFPGNLPPFPGTVVHRNP